MDEKVEIKILVGIQSWPEPIMRTPARLSPDNRSQVLLLTL
jgi:hypothetical protein